MDTIPDALPPDQYVIYALVDPTDEVVYYVGQSRNPKRRLGQHLAARHYKSKKGEWLRWLRQKGQQPLMRILEVVEGEKAALEREQEWIRHFMEQKMPLFNAEAQPKQNSARPYPLPIAEVCPLQTIISGAPPLIIARLPDGELSATLRSLCNLLGLSQRGQIQRIRRSPSLSEALREVIISTPGGPQQAEVLLNRAISTWAAGLHISRLTKAKQTAALELQRKAFAAIQQAFAQPKDTPPPHAPPVSEPPQSSLHQVSEGLLLAVKGIKSFEAEHQALKERVTALEGGSARSLVGYSPQRLAQLYLLAHRVRQRLGYPIAETLAALVAHFHVPSVFDLPEEDWPAILTWFSTLLEEW